MTFKKGDRVRIIGDRDKEKEGVISRLHQKWDDDKESWYVKLDDGTESCYFIRCLESVYKLRRCKMIDTKKLKIGKIIKAEMDGKIGLFEIATEYNESNEIVKCHGVSVKGQSEEDLERIRRDYTEGNWNINLTQIKQILSNSKTIEVGDDVVVKRKKGKNWHHSGSTKDGSMGKVEEVINSGDDYRIVIDGQSLLFRKNEVIKADTEFPKYAIIYDGNYEVSTWGTDLPLMKKEAEDAIKKTSDKKAVIYELKPLIKMQATIKIQNIGKKLKNKR